MDEAWRARPTPRLDAAVVHWVAWPGCRAQRAAEIATGQDRVATVALRLCTARGVADASAAVISAELFATRESQNGRQLGALIRLVPVLYRSVRQVGDQGISKAGGPRSDDSRCSWRSTGCGGSRPVP